MNKKKNCPTIILAAKYFKLFLVNPTKVQSYPKSLTQKETKVNRKAR